MRNCYRKLKQDGENVLNAGEEIAREGTASSDKDTLNKRKTILMDGVGEI